MRMRKEVKKKIQGEQKKQLILEIFERICGIAL